MPVVPVMTKTAVDRTRDWLENWVMGLELCPFARKPYELGRVRVVATAASGQDAVFRFVLAEMQLLFESGTDEVETSVLVIENALTDFADYLDFLGLLEAVLPETGLEGFLQIASFHPDYCFDGVDPEDVSNYTNRSPYPLFHLIREESLERALAFVDDPSQIPERNIALMQKNGLAEIRRLLGLSD